MTTAEDVGLGHRVVLLAPRTTPGRLRTRTADVLLAMLAGEIEVTLERRPPAPLFWGEVLHVPPGKLWSVRALAEPARLLVVAHPAGVEKVVAALSADPPLSPSSRLTLALDEGVELVL